MLTSRLRSMQSMVLEYTPKGTARSWADLHSSRPWMLMNAGRHHLRGQAWKGLRGRWQISKDGGIYPEWRGAGKKIFFPASSGSKGTVIMAVEVKGDGRTFESRLPKRLF